MTDRDAFFAAIRDDPGDDTPRLIFADWLDENGDPDRAEVIRVGCELAGPDLRLCSQLSPGIVHAVAPSCPGCDRADALRERERELLAAHAKAWLGDLAGPPFSSELKGFGWQILPDSAVWAQFRRGFVESVALSAADWLAHGSEILAVHPVTEVTLTTWPRLRFGSDFGRHRDEVRLDGRERWHDFRGEEFPVGQLASSILVPKVLEAEWPHVRTWNLPENQGGRYAVHPHHLIGSQPVATTLDRFLDDLRGGRIPAPGRDSFSVYLEDARARVRFGRAADPDGGWRRRRIYRWTAAVDGDRVATENPATGRREELEDPHWRWAYDSPGEESSIGPDIVRFAEMVYRDGSDCWAVLRRRVAALAPNPAGR